MTVGTRLRWRALTVVLALLGAMIPTAGEHVVARGGEAVSVRAIGATAFTLTSGAYRVAFAEGRLLIGRAGSAGGLRLSLLPGGPTVDLLAHVGRRAIVRTPERVTVRLGARANWADATIDLIAYTATPGLFRWKVALALHGATPANGLAGTDLSYFRGAGATPATPAIGLYTGAAPSATALTYLYDPDLGSSLFYVADLTALNPFFQATNGTPTTGPFRDPRGGPGSLVGSTAQGLGYSFPPSGLDGLGRIPVTIMDSYLLLGPGRPAPETAGAAQFLDALAAIYPHLQRPALAPADWRALGARTARDLAGPDVQVGLGGHSYLRAYVSDRRIAPELITQLNVLAGLLAYQRTFGGTTDTRRLVAMLSADLPSFYSTMYGTVVNNLPLPREPGAGTESWYLVGDLIDLARVAASGDRTARSLVLRSAEGAIALAHHVRYRFPRAITYGSWRGDGPLQPDVTGGYAYLMLQLYDLTHQQRYLREAEAGVEHLRGYGFQLAYETHITALAATAAARLYAITGQRRYMELSLLPLANLFAASWIWDCSYQLCAKGAYHTFFGLSPLPWSGYIAMMEQEQAWQALREYLLILGDSAPLSVRMLAAEFCRYSLSTLAYTLPPELPTGVAGPAPGEYSFVQRNRLDLAIPLEDLREGSQPSGQIGQEIYGAGGPLALAGLSAIRLAADLWLTAPYPVTMHRTASGYAITVAGAPGYPIAIQLQGGGLGRIGRILAGNGAAVPVAHTAGMISFQAEGGRGYTIGL